VLVEVNCESDFVARTDDFRELVHDIAMHIAASDPKFVRKEDVTPEAYEREKARLPESLHRLWRRSSKARWASSTRKCAFTNSRSSRIRR
jgi:translation elongation factor EF-Ts